MSQIFNIVNEWMKSNKVAFEQLGAEIELVWEDVPSLNPSVFIDGSTSKVIFRIVAWQNGQSELQTIALDDEKSLAVIDVIESDISNIDDALTRHLVKLKQILI